MALAFAAVMAVVMVAVLVLVRAKRKAAPDNIDPNAPVMPTPVTGELVADFLDRCGDDPHMQHLYPNTTARYQACDALWRASKMQRPDRAK